MPFSSFEMSPNIGPSTQKIPLFPHHRIRPGYGLAVKWVDVLFARHIKRVTLQRQAMYLKEIDHEEMDGGSSQILFCVI